MVGFFIPGETAVVIGGVLAGLGPGRSRVMMAVVVVCAIVGDSVGFEVGKRSGPWLARAPSAQGQRGGGHAPWPCSSATGARRCSSAGSWPSPGPSSPGWPA